AAGSAMAAPDRSTTPAFVSITVGSIVVVAATVTPFGRTTVTSTPAIDVLAVPAVDSLSVAVVGGGGVPPPPPPQPNKAITTTAKNIPNKLFSIFIIHHL